MNTNFEQEDSEAAERDLRLLRIHESVSRRVGHSLMFYPRFMSNCYKTFCR